MIDHRYIVSRKYIFWYFSFKDTGFLSMNRNLTRCHKLVISHQRLVKTFTMEEVKKHTSEESCWIVIDKNVCVLICNLRIQFY